MSFVCVGGITLVSALIFRQIKETPAVIAAPEGATTAGR
jgi:hypothetical protein